LRGAIAGVRIAACVSLVLLGAVLAAGQEYAGFDRNDYPGDAALTALRKDFRYTAYWLNNPPGEQQNSWTGKRALLKQHGFGFLALFNGRVYADLKGKDAAALGIEDGKAAVAAALREGFARNTLIFLDQEEGGRLLAEQAAYLFAWADAVRAAGARAGVYCSGIEVKDSSGTISTAKDILQREDERGKSLARAGIRLWVAVDSCPPSPGCTPAHPPRIASLSPELAGSAEVWQYAQSPRRTQFTAGCPANYSADGKCYAPGLAPGPDSFVDLNVARSPDPSEAR
jgi:hypothetical protein